MMVTRSLFRTWFGVLVGVAAVTLATRARAASSHADPEAGDSEGSTESTEVQGESESEEVRTNVPEKKTNRGRDDERSHKGQFNVRLALGTGYRIYVRYDDSPACSTAVDNNGDPKKMCGFGAPLSLDTAIGFAPLGGVEPFLWGRFGLAKESYTNTSSLVILGVGARLYTTSTGLFKFFVEPAVGAELENGAYARSDRTWNAAATTGTTVRYKQDFIVRLALGPQFDFSRYVGAYLAGGLTAGMLRAMHFSLDLHAGVQARFP
jgi:hypothetical protein